MDKSAANAGDKLRQYFNINDYSNSQEFEMRWLVHHVLRLYTKFEDSKQVADKIGVIDTRSYDFSASQFISQLMKKGDLRAALTICMCLENNFMKMRVLNQILG